MPEMAFLIPFGIVPAPRVRLPGDPSWMGFGRLILPTGKARAEGGGSTTSPGRHL
ncbi:MAG: hypothetical protein ABSB80_02940 [Methanoregula sp.]|uniref:hypothetical protein n=1 Tax=Methanoregula sp. TaxID=2052170 RepID=UPI003D137C3B